MQKKYFVSGMKGASCCLAVEQAAFRSGIVLKAAANLRNHSLTVALFDNCFDEEPLYQTVRKAGYALSAYRISDIEKSKPNFLFCRMLFSIALFFPLLFVSMGQWDFLLIPNILSDKKIGIPLQLILSLSIAILNVEYFVKGYADLFRKQPSLISLIALGATASLGYSIYASAEILFGAKSDFMLYYADAGMILSLGIVGQYLETRFFKKAKETLKMLSGPAKTEVSVFRNGTETVISSDQLKEGDTILLRPGDSVPADGKILEGQGCFEETHLTGKSTSNDLQKGEFVPAGAVCQTGKLKLLIQKTADNSDLSRTEAFAEKIYASKTPALRREDATARLLLPVILAIFFLSSAISLFISKDFETALKTGVSILILACPCSLGLAAPTILAAASEKGIKKGILFRSPETLELCGKTDTVVFEKAGVLTEGKLAVTQILSREGTEERIFALLASLYSDSEHPLGRTVAENAKEQKLMSWPCKDLTTLQGKEVSGTIHGKRYSALSLDAAKEFSPDFVLRENEKQTLCGKTAICCFEDDRCIGFALLEDRTKQDSPMTIKKLQDMGISCLLLSDDPEAHTTDIESLVGISQIFSPIPSEQRVENLRKLQQDGKKIAFVGFSAGNAPAMATADTGFALDSGARLLLKNADVFLKSDYPSIVCTALLLSKKTLRILKENLFWAFLFNILGICLAVTDRLPPLFAISAACLSSLCMIFQALRLRRF